MSSNFRIKCQFTTLRMSSWFNLISLLFLVDGMDSHYTDFYVHINSDDLISKLDTPKPIFNWLAKAVQPCWSSQQPASTGSWAITGCLYLWEPSSRNPWGVSKGQEKSLLVQTASIGFKGYCSPNWSQTGSVTCIMTSSPWEKRMRRKKNSC